MTKSLRELLDATTADQLRDRGSFKWTQPGPGGLGAAVAEMDFGAAPPILEALAKLSDDASFGYLPPALADGVALACAGFQLRRFGWEVDPALIRDVPDVLKALEICITRFTRPTSPVILPTPAYMPFLSVPPDLGREVIQVPMHAGSGYFTLDLDGIADAFAAGGDLLILCSPANPAGRVFRREEQTAPPAVGDAHGGQVSADEIHAPLVYPGARHIPYASTSPAAAAHTMTATSASKAWNLPGLKCAEVILTRPGDAARWADLPFTATHGTSNPGAAASIAAFNDGEPWLAEALAYLDDGRRLLADLLARHLPGVGHRSPEGTYLAWLDATAQALPDSPGALITRQAGVSVVDGPEFGVAGHGCFRLNFATPHPILTEMIERIAGVLTSA